MIHSNHDSSPPPPGSICAYAGVPYIVSSATNETFAGLPCGGESGVFSASTALESQAQWLEKTGWMVCDGRALSVCCHWRLFSVLRYRYGQGTKGKSHFCIPDLRGLFLRGVDAGAGVDPNAASRYSPTGDPGDDGVGSLQCDTLQKHVHDYTTSSVSEAATGTKQVAATTSSKTPTEEPKKPARSSTETRPKNIAVYYLIRFR